MKIICISGKAQNGKDTTAEIMRKELENSGKSVVITHYGDLVKHICRFFFGWNGVKDEAGRHILQYIGTDIIRTQRPNYWVDFIISVLELFKDEWDYVLIPDCRFPNEIDAMRNAGFDTTAIRIIRHNFESPLTKEQQEHPSEIALDDYAFDYTIYNDGTIEDLHDKILEWIRGQKNEKPNHPN